MKLSNKIRQDSVNLDSDLEQNDPVNLTKRTANKENSARNSTKNEVNEEKGKGRLQREERERKRNREMGVWCLREDEVRRRWVLQRREKEKGRGDLFEREGEKGLIV